MIFATLLALAQASAPAPAPYQRIEEVMAAAVDEAVAAGERPSASPFNPEQDNAAAVDAALIAARASGKHVMIVFGGSWCHDSDALISAFAPRRAQAMLAARYEMVWVDVPYGRDEREFAVARRFGLGEIEGTPTVLIVRADGTAVNLSDAPRWRNAASRKPAAMVRHFERAVPAVTAGR
jgi:Thioredoxin-like